MRDNSEAQGPFPTRQLTYKELPIGATSTGVIVDHVKTGTWRLSRPVLDDSKCILCLKCWISCPDVCIILDRQEEVLTIDYDYCKGCGICEYECPVRAIRMEREEV